MTGVLPWVRKRGTGKDETFRVGGKFRVELRDGLVSPKDLLGWVKRKLVESHVIGPTSRFIHY